jgi:transcriptional regulator with XRE-family HTH domain
VPIGIILRNLRKERRLTGVELSDKVGVSRSLISQIERGSASPSIEVLRRISAALDVPMGTFFEEEGNGDEAERVARGNHAGLTMQASSKPALIDVHKRLRLMLPQSNLVHEMCTPLSNRQIQVIRSTIQPKEGGPAEPFSHPGLEAMYVIAGELTVVVESTEYVLHAGSCLSFESTLPHRLLNHGDEPAEVLSFITPAAY